MTIYNLLTFMNDQPTGVESFTADDDQDAVAYASGVLAERTKGCLDMFETLKVRWALDTGERKLGDVTTASGPQIGSWSSVARGKGLELVWRRRAR